MARLTFVLYAVYEVAPLPPYGGMGVKSHVHHDKSGSGRAPRTQGSGGSSPVPVPAFAISLSLCLIDPLTATEYPRRAAMTASLENFIVIFVSLLFVLKMLAGTGIYTKLVAIYSYDLLQLLISFTPHTRIP